MLLFIILILISDLDLFFLTICFNSTLSFFNLRLDFFNFSFSFLSCFCSWIIIFILSSTISSIFLLTSSKSNCSPSIFCFLFSSSFLTLHLDCKCLSKLYFLQKDLPQFSHSKLLSIFSSVKSSLIILLFWTIFGGIWRIFGGLWISILTHGNFLFRCFYNWYFELAKSFLLFFYYFSLFFTIFHYFFTIFLKHYSSSINKVTCVLLVDLPYGWLYPRQIY